MDPFKTILEMNNRSQLTDIESQATNKMYLVKEINELFAASLINATLNSYINDSGTVATLSTWKVTDFIPVTEDVTYIISQVKNGALYIGCYFDADKTFVSAIPVPTLSITSKVYTTAPATAKFMRINVDPSLTLEFYSVKEYVLEYDNLVGKKLNVIGDSITFGSYSSARYSDMLLTMMELSAARNYGIAGTRVASIASDASAMSVRYVNMDNDADLIFVLAGLNDFMLDTPLGTIADADVTTFYGAYKILISGLIDKYPFRKITAATPLHCNNTSAHTVGEFNSTTNLYLKDYVSAIKDVCQYYGVPCLDLYATSELQPSNINIAYAYMPDKLHINSNGHRLIASKIFKFLNAQ